MTNKIIENCSGCGKSLTAHQLVNDPRFRVIGMAYKDNDQTEAYYFFQHDTPDCGTSLLIDVSNFTGYIPETIRAANDSGCGCGDGFCIHIDNLKDCGRECYLLPYRELLFRMIKIKDIHREKA